MKVIILYEQKKYTCEMKQSFTREDIICNMRKKLGDNENQKYILSDYNGINIKPNHYFYPDEKEITLILMKIPHFNPEEPLYNDNIKDDISNATDDPLSLIDLKLDITTNHGNPDKKRESCFELIANIYGSFTDLPDLVKETMKK